jgi:predicted metal-binding membrane protein
MAVLFVMGTMNLVWMGILSIVIFVEKIMSHGVGVGKATGVALIFFGMTMTVGMAPLSE